MKRNLVWSKYSIVEKCVIKVLKLLKKDEVGSFGFNTNITDEDNAVVYDFSICFFAGKLVGEEKCIEGEFKNFFKYSLSYGNDINDTEAKQLFYKIGNSILMNVGY